MKRTIEFIFLMICIVVTMAESILAGIYLGIYDWRFLLIVVPMAVVCTYASNGFNKSIKKH